MSNPISSESSPCVWADGRWPRRDEQHVQKTSVEFRGEQFWLGEGFWLGSDNLWHVVAFLSDDEPLLRRAVHGHGCRHYVYDCLTTLVKTRELTRIDNSGGYVIELDEEMK